MGGWCPPRRKFCQNNTFSLPLFFFLYLHNCHKSHPNLTHNLTFVHRAPLSPPIQNSEWIALMFFPGTYVQTIQIGSFLKCFMAMVRCFNMNQQTFNQETRALCGDKSNKPLINISHKTTPE